MDDQLLEFFFVWVNNAGKKRDHLSMAGMCWRKYDSFCLRYPHQLIMLYNFLESLQHLNL